MRVAVFGANGPTGLILTRDILGAGHDAVAVTRSPNGYPITDRRLTVVGADATDPVAVKRALHGTDAVVSTLGTSFSRDRITLYSASATAITQAMTDTGVSRLIVTSAGLVSSWNDPESSWFARTIVRPILNRIGRTLYEDMRHMESIVSATELTWTIMRPRALVNLEPPTAYQIAEADIAGRFTARRDLAAAITDQISRTDYHQKIAAIATTNRHLSMPVTMWREAIKPKLTN